MARTLSTRNSPSAFTLVEMLVSVSVLVLIMTFIGQMMSSVTLSTTLSSKHIDTDNQARLVFDRMAIDFAGMPHRQDVDFIFSKQTGTPDPSDKMFFFSEAPAYFDTTKTGLFPAPGGEPDPKSSVSLIGYSIYTGLSDAGSAGTATGAVAPPPYCLQRLSKGLTWDAQYPASGPGGLMFLTFNPAKNGNSMQPLDGSTLSLNSFTTGAVGTKPTYAGTDPGFDTLATQVFRMEFCFQVKSLSASGQPAGTVFSNYPIAQYPNGSPLNIGPQDSDPSTNAVNIPVGERWYNSKDNRGFVCTGVTSTGNTATTNWSPLGLSDVTAIVVTIAVMDTNSRKTLSQTELQNAAVALPDFAEPSPPSATTPLMATTWLNALNNQAPTFASTAGIPQFAASQIRVYQRFFYLNNN
jgi:hypothetical protein